MTTNANLPTLGRYRFLGITDDITTCDCCGKTNLKRTIALHPLTDETDIRHYGSDCAARALRSTAARVKRTAERAQHLADAYAERTARFQATLEMIDAALADAGSAWHAFAALSRAAHAGNPMAWAAVNTAESTANLHRDDHRHPLLQARDWYAKHL